MLLIKRTYRGWIFFPRFSERLTVKEIYYRQIFQSIFAAQTLEGELLCL